MTATLGHLLAFLLSSRCEVFTRHLVCYLRQGFPGTAAGSYCAYFRSVQSTSKSLKRYFTISLEQINDTLCHFRRHHLWTFLVFYLPSVLASSVTRQLVYTSALSAERAPGAPRTRGRTVEHSVGICARNVF